MSVDIEPGKTLIIRLLTVGDPHEDGARTVFFELNGQPRDVTVRDRALEPDAPRRPRADPTNPSHVGSTMPGMVVSVAARAGDPVAKGQTLLLLEAMKMQASIAAEQAGTVEAVHVKPGTQVEVGDLLVTMKQ